MCILPCEIYLYNTNNASKHHTNITVIVYRNQSTCLVDTIKQSMYTYKGMFWRDNSICGNQVDNVGRHRWHLFNPMMYTSIGTLIQLGHCPLLD